MSNESTPTDEPLPNGIAAAAPQIPASGQSAPEIAATVTTRTFCANCGTPLLGAHCYACGQPVKGMVRQLSSILSDVADTIFNIDSRIFRTLLPLYFRPGFLTNEYFAGRRVRYVTPFRLYFFLSVAAFLLMQLSMDSFEFAKDMHVDFGDGIQIRNALTEQEVNAQRDTLIAAAKAIPGVRESKIARVKKHFEEIADHRIAYLKSIEQAKTEGRTPPPEVNGIFSDEGAWDPAKNPVHVDWLSNGLNGKLNDLLLRMANSARRAEQDPKPLVAGAFGALPQVLFVLMPLFAILLKIFYIFKRRLYMEHLIVALHSHSFIFSSLLLLTLAGLAHGWALVSAPWLASVLGWMIVAMAWWLPIYLLIMQKRVYRQGWFFTLFKYSAVGFCYIMLISFGIAAAILVSLATI